MSDDLMNDISAVLSANKQYDPGEVVLIGAHMEPLRGDHQEEDRRTGDIKVKSDLSETLTIKCHPIEDASGGNATDPAIAVIYAYAYEGHTYRLPKPRIMVVRSMGEPYEPGDSSGGTPVAGKLTMWRMSKHDRTASLEVTSGSIEKLVLEDNQPGNTSAISYHSHMQLSHRGGRLT